MTCDVARLSALADGDLSARQSKRVRAHVEVCAACKKALADLEIMRRGLGALPGVEGDDGFAAIAARLAAAPAPRRTGALAWRPSWRVAAPALAAVFVGVVALGALRWKKGRGLSANEVVAAAEGEFRAADAHYRRAVDELQKLAERERESWPLPKRAEYEAAQKQLEAAVARCRQVAEDRPADLDAEELLFAAYRKEIRFFEDEMMREAR